jgi:hypothetical protein
MGAAVAIPADDPETVVRAFLRAVSAHDATRFNELVFPRMGADRLVGTEPVEKARLDDLETEIKTLRLRQLQPLRNRGVTVTPDSAGVYPDGTTTRYMAPFDGQLVVISLVKKSGRWLVDVRWWLRVKEMALRDPKSKPEEKELVIKTFLLNLLRLNRNAVSRSLVTAASVDLVFEGAPQQPEPSDQLPALAIEMPLVEADADEIYPLPSGRLVKRGASQDETVMVGLYGPSEMVFHLRRVNGEWRIAPEPYYHIINR